MVSVALLGFYIGLIIHAYFQVVGRVGFTSSLLNSEAPKLLSVIITTLKVTRLPGQGNGTNRGSNGPVVTAVRRKLKAPTVVSNLVQVELAHVM